MNIHVTIPEQISIPETDLSVVFGNLMENAIDAVSYLPEGERKITVIGTRDKGAVLLEVTNPYTGGLRQNKYGKIISTKSQARGLGLESVSAIVQSHNGMMEIDTDHDTFRVSVYIPC